MQKPQKGKSKVSLLAVSRNALLVEECSRYEIIDTRFLI